MKWLSFLVSPSLFPDLFTGELRSSWPGLRSESQSPLQRAQFGAGNRIICTLPNHPMSPCVLASCGWPLYAGIQGLWGTELQRADDFYRDRGRQSTTRDVCRIRQQDLQEEELDCVAVFLHFCLPQTSYFVTISHVTITNITNRAFDEKANRRRILATASLLLVESWGRRPGAGRATDETTTRQKVSVSSVTSCRDRARLVCLFGRFLRADICGLLAV